MFDGMGSRLAVYFVGGFMILFPPYFWLCWWAGNR